MDGTPGVSEGEAPQYSDSSKRLPMSLEAFLHITSIAWGSLGAPAQKAVRASCRSGLLQHDRLLSHLHVSLGHAVATPDPVTLSASLRALLARGARLQSLAACFHDHQDVRREAQLLAALEACRGCPLSRLELRGAVPLSRAMAAAVQACCAQLSSLRVTQSIDDRPGLWRAQPPPEMEAWECQLGVEQLLTRCGPRLTDLQLVDVPRPRPPLQYREALGRCTALTSLVLQPQSLDGPTVEVHIYTAVAQLQSLRSLHLHPQLDCTPEALRPHATAVARLSALTALTHLRFEPSHCYEHDTDSWYKRRKDGAQHGAWCEVREAHRAALLSALRAMPQLQHLDCPTLWLHPTEAASLTALTSLALGGLLPPPPTERTPGLPSGRGSVPCPPGALPPQLVELVLRDSASPRIIARLQPPPPFARLQVRRLRFGTSDLTPEGRLTAEAVQAVGPAVRRLLAFPGAGPGTLGIVCDGGPGKMRPREGVPNGHVEWILQLRGLDACHRGITFGGVALGVGDMDCLAHMLPTLEAVELRGCTFPLTALLALRNAMPRLRHLVVDIAGCGATDSSTLQSVLLLLLRPQARTMQLGRLQCVGCPAHLDTVEVQRCVMGQLQGYYGVTGVELTLEKRTR